MPPNAPAATKSESDTETNRPAAAKPVQAKSAQQQTNVRTAVTRIDPITGQTTIFAPERDARPDQFPSNDLAPANTSVGCPFCSGSESLTPPPVWIGRKTPSQIFASSPAVPSSMPNSASLAHQASLARLTSLAHFECIDDPAEMNAADDRCEDWLVRVVPNKFPAITPMAGLLATGDENTNGHEGKLFHESPVSGGHEVIVESPEHIGSLTELGSDHLTLVLAAFRDRIGYWHNVPGVKYISAFKNCGGDAGASLAHSHSQVIATDVMPSHLRETLSRTAKYRAESGCCLQCDLIRAEIKDKSRIVATSNSLVAFCPFASPMPMGVRITTRNHCDRFDLLDDETIESIARMLKRVASWIEHVLPGSSYNVVLNSRPPAATSDEKSYHWTLDIFPRLARIAGFEFGSHCMINSVMPETAAAKYRQCASNEDPRRIR